MGVRLGCQARSALSHHRRHTLPRASDFTHQVLYVCEGVSSSVGGAMAAARDRSSTRYPPDATATMGFPIQVELPDGEEPHYHPPSMRHHSHLAVSEQEAEITREYIKPPANKTLSDLQCCGPHRSCSVGMLSSKGFDWVNCGPHSHHHRHSAPLEASRSSSHHPHTVPSHHPHSGSSSSSSSSSSWSGWGCGEDGRGSPRRPRKTNFAPKGIQQLLANFTTPKYERSTNMCQQDGNQANIRHQSNTPPPIQETPHSPHLFSSAPNTLADITVVPCGPVYRPNALQLGGQGQAHHGSMGVNYPLYEPFSQSRLSPNVEHDDDDPPLYSDVIDNPTLYTSVSRSTEQRTNSGKI